MAGIRELKKKETREAILHTAVRLFGSKGFEKTSIGELAREAGVVKGTIYGYFQTKEEIFLAFCEMEIDYAMAVLAGVEGDPPLVERLLTLFLSQFRFVTENREFGRLLVREMSFPRDAAAVRSRGLDARYLGALQEILREAAEKGEIREDHDPFLTSVHFFALYLIALSGWYTGYVSSYAEVEESLRTLFTQALEGLAPRRGDTVEVER